ncbi:MAG: ATP-binding protein [Deltaproteobacteria bacterium]|nr:ATP-binding protein [Deltaproteobacteria bacterium]
MLNEFADCPRLSWLELVQGDFVDVPDTATGRGVHRKVNQEGGAPPAADNAIDLSNPSSYVAIAVFDDRIEFHSIGAFPTGIHAELLTQDHRSIPRNPLIAGAFHRTGAIEVWGRGTNQVIEACRSFGVPAPTFSELSGAVTVALKAEVVAGATKSASTGALSRHQVRTKSALSREQVQVLEIASVPRSLTELAAPSGRTDRTKFRDQVLRPLLDAQLLTMTIPDKPRSSKQQYVRTDAGRAAIEKR